MNLRPAECQSLNKKKRGTTFRAFGDCPRECRQAGILNLDSVGSLSSRIRHARHEEHTQQQFRWSATDAFEHWSTESMTLTNTAGNPFGDREDLLIQTLIFNPMRLENRLELRLHAKDSTPKRVDVQSQRGFNFSMRV